MTIEEAVYLGRTLKTGTSRKPAGVGYEVWKALLSCVEGRDWFRATFDTAMWTCGDFPDEASLLVIITG